MDAELEEKLKQLKERVEVFEGENPLMKAIDAIRLAERNGVLYRWANNGSYYQIRWTEAHSPFSIMEHDVCGFVYDRIMETVEPKAVEKPPSKRSRKKSA